MMGINVGCIDAVDVFALKPELLLDGTSLS